MVGPLGDTTTPSMSLRRMSIFTGITRRDNESGAAYRPLTLCLGPGRHTCLGAMLPRRQADRQRAPAVLANYATTWHSLGIAVGLLEFAGVHGKFP